MQQDKHTPTFNMKAVVRETGLKPDTLRAWERRYGLPIPDRSTGGHRLYSQRDIDTLKWLIARQDEGISISHAVEMWHRIESQGQDPMLVEPSTRAVGDVTSFQAAVAGETVAEYREAWINACMQFDEALAERILGEAFSIYAPEVVSFEVLRQGISEIGDRWYQGKTTVQQEHFASELAMRRLEAMIAGANPPTRPGRILIACPAGEEHTFSALIMTLLLRRRGWNVIYLGANVPKEQFETTIESAKPQIVLLSAQQLTTAATLLETANLLQSLGVRLAFGGRIFNQLPQLHHKIPGYFLGDELEGTAYVVEQLLTLPREKPVVEEISPEYQALHRSFKRNYLAIEGRLSIALQEAGFPAEQLAMANGYLTHNIIAGLTLGDINLLNGEIHWLQGMLADRETGESLLAGYLHGYRDALNAVLGSDGRIVADWLDRMAANSSIMPT